MTSEQPPPGTGTKPVPGEPTEAEYTRVAQALLAAMPANLPQRQMAVILAGALVGAWRHGYWAGGHTGTEVEHAQRMSDGSMQVRPSDPENEQVYPLPQWIVNQQLAGGTVYERVVIVVQGWREVPDAEHAG